LDSVRIDFVGTETVDWPDLDSVDIEIDIVVSVVDASVAVDMIRIEVVECNCSRFDLDCKLDSGYQVGIAVLKVALHSTFEVVAAAVVDCTDFHTS
jgi:hypothetical protein